MKKENLHKIAPKLSEIILCKNSFKIPKNYFNTVEDAIIAELKTENFKNKTTTKTVKIPKNYFNSIEDIVIAKLKAKTLQKDNTTTVPKNYFETIENTILNKINVKPKATLFKNKIVKLVAPIAIAASILVAFILKNNTNTITFSSLATSEIEYWITNESTTIDALSIASIFPDIELNRNNLESLITTEEFLEYLNQEDLEEIFYEN